MRWHLTLTAILTSLIVMGTVAPAIKPVFGLLLVLLIAALLVQTVHEGRRDQ
jgi:uncharacterized membrane protein